MEHDQLTNLMEKLQINTYDIARKLIRESPQLEDAEVICNWLGAGKHYDLIFVTIAYIYAEGKLFGRFPASDMLFRVCDDFFSIFRSVKGE